MMSLHRLCLPYKGLFTTPAKWNHIPRAGNIALMSLNSGLRMNSTVRELKESSRVTVDKELPDPLNQKNYNLKVFCLYAVGVAVASFFTFNYEKVDSPIVNSVLYCLRRSDETKKALGENIGYKYSWVWIKGPLNTKHGNIDISFSVKGSRNSGVLYLTATRESRYEPFNIHRYELQVEDSEKTTINLLDDPSVELGL